jgi:hypothetical protein
MTTGTLSLEQLNRALENPRETLQRLGFILTHYQIISAQKLKDALQLQIMQIIYRLFRWKDGDYQFSQETTIEYDRDNVTPITAESILMEGARMMDEWPIIEKRVRSYDMVFRRKLTDQEIVVVGADEADEVDFGSDATSARKRKAGSSDKIRISPEDKAVFDLVDGTMKVGDIVEVSKLSEFDTNKALYELLTRDLIEEVRGKSALPRAETPVDETEVAETPVPLPLVVVLTVLALASIVTSVRNPMNRLNPFRRPTSAIGTAQKAISMERIEAIGQAIEKYDIMNGHLPTRLQDLTPQYIDANLLSDPWGNAYKYLQRPERYLVIGFAPDGKADTDLFLSRVIDIGPTTPVQTTRPDTGGIQLIE